MRIYIKYLFLILFVFSILFNCKKDKEDKIKFKEWHDAIIVEDSTLIAQNEIGEFKKGLFKTSIKLDELKNAYIEKGYEEDPNKENRIIKKNVRIDFIRINEEQINILIDILPKKN